MNNEERSEWQRFTDAATGQGTARQSFLSGGFLLKYSHVITFFVLVAIASVMSPHFMTVTNILNVMRGASMVGIVAIGMTVVILARGIDLSAGSIVGISAITAASLAYTGSPIAWIAALALCTAIGAVNGLMITRLSLQPFIATLAMMIFARGVIYLWSDGGDVFAEGADQMFRFIGSGHVLGIPFPVILFLLLWLVMIYVMHHTRWGRHVYAVGANEEAARVYGIRVDRIKVQVYALAGFFSGLAGLVLVSRISVAELAPVSTGHSGITMEA